VPLALLPGHAHIGPGPDKAGDGLLRGEFQTPVRLHLRYLQNRDNMRIPRPTMPVVAILPPNVRGLTIGIRLTPACGGRGVVNHSVHLSAASP
jgi:hypothetical protein